MKWITYAILLFFLALFPIRAFAQVTLQEQIDNTPPHGSIHLKSGIYDETIVIRKPITIQGNGNVTIRSCSTHPVVSIEGSSVILHQLKIEQCSQEQDTAAISISGTDHRLEQIDINTKQFGIKLNQAQNVKLLDGKIVGDQGGNGIDLWESNSNTITNMDIQKVSDGIYIESSHGNKLLGNTVNEARYGMHLMFSNDTLLQDNISHRNITGVMIMSATNTLVKANTFSYNSHNVNAQGILLYDAQGTVVAQNIISNNRVGVFIENSEQNKLIQNKIIDNFIGVQFKNAGNNEMNENTLFGNVNVAQAVNSENNDVSYNHWDTPWKLDTTGNGVSSIPYQADPFLLTLTTEVPAYQLFFQSPGMVILQALLKSPPESLLIDKTPLMDSAPKIVPSFSSNRTPWAMGLLFTVISLLLFIWGGKRK